MRWLSLLIISILLSGCGVRYHLKRAQRHLKKAEQLGADVEKDTVYLDNTVFVPEVTKDTVFQSVQGDTVVIQKEKLSIRYVRLPQEKVYIEGKCLPDTIKIKVPVQVKTTIGCPPCKWRLWHVVVGVVGGLLAGAGLIKLFG